MFKRVSKAFWLVDSDEDEENDAALVVNAKADRSRKKTGAAAAVAAVAAADSGKGGKAGKKPGRKKIRLGKVPVVTGFEGGMPAAAAADDGGGGGKTKQLRRSLYSPQKKAARLTASPGKGRPGGSGGGGGGGSAAAAAAKKKKKGTYTRRKKRGVVKSWDVGTLIKTTNPADLDFILGELAAAATGTAEGTAAAGGAAAAAAAAAGGGPAGDMQIRFPSSWTTQDSFRVQGVCLKLGFSKVLTHADEFVLRISTARAAKIAADVDRARAKGSAVAAAADAAQAMGPPAITLSAAASAASAASSGKKKKKKKKKTKGKQKDQQQQQEAAAQVPEAAVDEEPAQLRGLGASPPPLHHKRMSFSTAALNRMRRASFAPAQWATKFSGRGSSTSVRLSCIPPLAPASRSSAAASSAAASSAAAAAVISEADEEEEGGVAAAAGGGGDGDDSSVDLDMSMESVEEALGAPSNVDLATRRRQTEGRLSVSSVAGDVVRGSVGYAVASVFDPLLLSHVLDFVSYAELLGSCAAVSRAWNHIAVKLASMVVVSRGCDEDGQDGGDSVVFSSWSHFVRKFPRGTFLAAGGCKAVHRVWSSVQERWEAVAVVDVAAIEDGVAQEQFARETECTYLLSNLVAQRVCPNFIELYQVFRLCFPPSPRLWGSEECPVPKQPAAGARRTRTPRAPPQSSRGVFQYQRMELCDALDLEEFMRRMPEGGGGAAAGAESSSLSADPAGKALPLAQLAPVMFQMVFSLYAARHQVALCHYDVKLLNFLVQNVRVADLDDRGGDNDAVSTAAAADAARGAADDAEAGLGLSYALGDATFELGVLPSEWNREPATCRVVKLADFGTSYFDGATDGNCAKEEVVGDGADGGGLVQMGAPVDDPRFFTTLENTPIDFLVLGTDARQGYEADTWCLGLSFVHLLTGGQPYEETLEAVECPAALDEALSRLWLTEPRYRVLAGLDSDYPHVLQDTFYRYLVLLGFGFGTEFTRWPDQWRGLQVFAVLRKHLLAGAERSAASAQFQGDVEQYAFGRGTHPAIAFATARLDALDAAWQQTQQSEPQEEEQAPAASQRRGRAGRRGGASPTTAAAAAAGKAEAVWRPAAVVASLLRFDPAERPTMFEVLRSSLFAPLRNAVPGAPANFDFYRNFSFRELPRV